MSSQTVGIWMSLPLQEGKLPMHGRGEIRNLPMGQCWQAMEVASRYLHWTDDVKDVSWTAVADAGI
jgi:hypothetical protein